MFVPFSDVVPFTHRYVGSPGLFPSNVTAEVNWNDGTIRDYMTELYIHHIEL